jgi:uncharacterized protein (DUF2147 family)
MNQNKLEKEVRFLKIYAGVATLIAIVMLVTAFTVGKNKKFDEIDVERINIVEKDGKLKMVISNKGRQHPGTMDGKYYKEREGKRQPGIIFFSEKGDEMGGLVFDGDTGKEYGGSLTFDRFRSDQSIQFSHDEDKDGNYFAGMRMNDQNTPLTALFAKQEEIEKLPTKEAKNAAYKEMQDKGMFMVNRLKMGRGNDKSAFIDLKDGKGKTRIKISVEANGNPKINFLDENGKVIYSLPENQMVKK